MKISIDFDGTLSYNREVQEFVKFLINLNIEVHITTARYSDNKEMLSFFSCDNSDLYNLAEEVGIKKENINFNNMELKSLFFKDNPEFLFHLDDDDVEIKFINLETKVPAINVKNKNWKKQCLNILEKKKMFHIKLFINKISNYIEENYNIVFVNYLYKI